MKNQPACQYCPYRPVCGREFSDRDVENERMTLKEAMDAIKKRQEESSWANKEQDGESRE